MNDLHYIFYDAKRMYLDTSDMTPIGGNAHRRLCDYIWFNDGPPVNQTKALQQITLTDAAEWGAVKRELLRKGWLETGDYLLHRGAIKSLNESKAKYVENFNRQAKMNKVLPLELLPPDAVTGVVTYRVTPTVTPPVTRTQSKSEPQTESEQIHPQPSQSSSANGGHAADLTKLTIKLSSLDRIAGDILSNKHSWAYDNCRVRPEHFPVRKSLVTELTRWVNRVRESAVHAAWQEAVRRTDAAHKDQLVDKTVAGYCIACWREALQKEAGAAALNDSGEP